ncbi:hypothetical protein ACKKBF_B14565 [Auxenochlorella protothecoides x Auxenochlorella symbiontica]
MHCLTCGGVSSYNKACSERAMGVGMLSSVSAWWPAGLTNPRVYFALHAARLRHDIAAREGSESTWRTPSSSPQTSGLRARRRGSRLQVKLPVYEDSLDTADIQHVRKVDALQRPAEAQDLAHSPKRRRLSSATEEAPGMSLL